MFNKKAPPSKTRSWCFLYSFILLLSLLTSISSKAEIDCNRFLSNIKAPKDAKSKLPKINTFYRVQFKGDPVIYTAYFMGLVEVDGEIKAKFSTGSWKQKIHFAGENDIFEWREWNPKLKTGLGALISFPIEQLIMAKTMGNLMFHKYLDLAQNEEAVEVVGELLSSKSVGQNIADRLQKFDYWLTASGFKRPKLTRVVIAGKRLLFPNLVGPFSLSWPSLNIWRGGDGGVPVIAMNAFFYSRSLVDDESVLYHERTHSVLHRTYNKEAFVNQDDALQEAFADFFAAHFTNNTNLAVASNGKPMRNIRNRSAHYISDDYRESLFDVDKDSYHDNSLIMSNLFWRLRKTIGVEATNQILKSLIDNLNSYRDSYERLLKLETNKKLTKDPRQLFAYNMEYTLSVIIKMSKDWSSNKEVRLMIEDFNKDMNFTMDRLDHVAAILQPSNQDYSYTNKGELYQGIIVNLYGFMGFAVEGSFLYWLAQIF